MAKRKLQVFISSTFTDLVAERQAAVEAVLKAGHIPAGMELFTSGDVSQLSTIKRWIDDSDVYMLILGGRYGSIEPTTGISYTELEYDYARQQGKASFAIVITEGFLADKVKSLGTSAVELQEPKSLGLFREKVLGNISAFFSDLKDIRLTVYESLSEIDANLVDGGWLPASDFEDTKPLHAEIAKLKAQLEVAKSAPTQAKKAQTSSGIMNDDETTELVSLFGVIEVTIPDELLPDDDKANNKRDLLSLFVKNSAVLTAGVTNSMQADDVENFLYHSVCPKLMVHGLVDNEKVVGVRYRRSFVNERGRSFLANTERRLNRKKLEAKNNGSDN